MITFRIESISPDKAVKWLAENTVNRKLRPGKVQQIVNTIKSGKWRITHQGIAFDTNGRLIDGQHRLTAIARAGVTVECVVARYDISTTAIALPLDMNAVRSVTDIHGMARREKEICGCLMRVVNTSNMGVVTYDDYVSMNEVVGPIHQKLMGHCGMSKKTRTSAAVRSAIVIHASSVIGMPAEIRVYEQYKAFVTQDFESMWPSVAALFRWTNDNNGVAKALHGWEVTKEFIVRCVYAFDESKKNSKMCRVTDLNKEYLGVRRMAMEMIESRGIKLSFLTQE